MGPAKTKALLTQAPPAVYVAPPPEVYVGPTHYREYRYRYR